MEKKVKKSSLFAGPFAIAAVTYGTHVGPGFASGAQIVNYFPANGWVGILLGPLFVCLFSGVVLFLVLEYARIKRTFDYRSLYDSIFGKFSFFFSNLKEVVIVITTLLVCSLCYATGSEILRQMFNIPPLLGGSIIMLVITLLVIFGANVVRASSTIITVLLIAMMVFIGINGIGSALPAAMETMAQQTMYKGYMAAFIKMFSYVMLILSYLDVTVAVIKPSIKSTSDSIKTALISTLLIGGSTIMMTILFSAGMPAIAKEPLPTLWMLNNIIGAGTFTRLLYAAIAILAIFSTGVGGIYGIVAKYEERVHKYWKNSTSIGRSTLVTVAFVVGSILLGQFGVLGLVQYGYGIMSFLLVPVFYIPFLFIIPVKLWKKKKNAALPEQSEEA